MFQKATAEYRIKSAERLLLSGISETPALKLGYIQWFLICSVSMSGVDKAFYAAIPLPNTQMTRLEFLLLKFYNSSCKISLTGSLTSLVSN